MAFFTAILWRKTVKFGSLAWAGILSSLTASSCRNTPGNTPLAETTPQASPTSIATAEPSTIPAPNATVAAPNSAPDSTGLLLQEAKGKASRTAKFGAGGGAAGALIGGIAGGGKEALIGAAAGAGAGAGVAGSGFTGNKDLTIPAESVLQFKLTQPQRLAAGGTHKPKSDSNG